MKKRTVGICERMSCPEPAHGDDGLCAFHHLEELGAADLGFEDEGFGGLEEERYLALLLDTADQAYEEELMILVCKHGAVLGQCYLGDCSNIPGLGLTPWELRSVTYSEAIPYN
jgi:hypothetical protein